MPWLVAPMLALGVVAATGSASSTIYVPGEYRDGVYTHPHFLDGPVVKGLEMDSEDANPPKPIIIDEPAAPKQPPSEAPS